MGGILEIHGTKKQELHPPFRCNDRRSAVRPQDRSAKEAKSWELRASTSLARLWQQQSKRAEAHQMLLEIYNWFTEGFDTKDLQEAKALIKELGD